MDGPALINFTIAAMPDLIEQVLVNAKLEAQDVDLFLLHQATRKMLEQLQERLGVGDDRLPIIMEDCGNTVSSTIPILINELRKKQRIRLGKQNMLIGFGVGWSWAGCLWKENWQG